MTLKYFFFFQRSLNIQNKYQQSQGTMRLCVQGCFNPYVCFSPAQRPGLLKSALADKGPQHVKNALCRFAKQCFAIPADLCWHPPSLTYTLPYCLNSLVPGSIWFSQMLALNAFFAKSHTWPRQWLSAACMKIECTVFRHTGLQESNT